MTDADRAREQQIRKRTESHHCVSSSDTLFVLDQLAAARQARAALETNRDECVAVFEMDRKHELIGPVAECACPSCNLHCKYAAARETLEQALLVIRDVDEMRSRSAMRVEGMQLGNYCRRALLRGAGEPR